MVAQMSDSLRAGTLASSDDPRYSGKGPAIEAAPTRTSRREGRLAMEGVLDVMRRRRIETPETLSMV